MYLKKMPFLYKWALAQRLSFCNSNVFYLSFKVKDEIVANRKSLFSKETSQYSPKPLQCCCRLSGPQINASLAAGPFSLKPCGDDANWSNYTKLMWLEGFLVMALHVFVVSAFKKYMKVPKLLIFFQSDIWWQK